MSGCGEDIDRKELLGSLAGLQANCVVLVFEVVYAIFVFHFPLLSYPSPEKRDKPDETPTKRYKLMITYILWCTHPVLYLIDHDTRHLARSHSLTRTRGIVTDSYFPA